MKNIKIILALLFQLLSLSCYSQNIIRGIITDSHTQTPILGVNVYDANNNKGTITNEDGEFEITVSKIPTKINISHLSYKKIELDVLDSKPINIELALEAISLPEFTAGNPAVALIRSVIEQAEKNKENTRYFNAFYQKTSSFGQKYSKLHEVFFNVGWSPTGVTQWRPLNSRYAQLDEQVYTFANFLDILFIDSRVYSSNPAYPINDKNLTENYIYKIDKIIKKGDNTEIAVISCNPKKKKGVKLTFTGLIFIDTKDELLLKLQGTYDYKRSSKWDYTREVDINFKTDNKKNHVFEYAFVKYTSRHRLTQKKNIEKGWMYFLEEINGLGQGKSYKPFEVKNDLEILEKTPYNYSFWKKNVPIKHTAIEEEVIRYFEKKGSFNSNFK